VTRLTTDNVVTRLTSDKFVTRLTNDNVTYLTSDNVTRLISDNVVTRFTSDNVTRLTNDNLVTRLTSDNVYFKSSVYIYIYMYILNANFITDTSDSQNYCIKSVKMCCPIVTCSETAVPSEQNMKTFPIISTYMTTAWETSVWSPQL
jgi:hypothetical protein